MKLIPIRNKPNLYRHPSTKIIYFRMYRKGLGRCEKSTGETVLARAVEKSEKIRADFLNEKYVSKNTNKARLVCSELWPEFLEIKKNKSKATYDSMEIQGRVHLVPFFKDYFPHEIDESLWSKYVAHAKSNTPGRKLFNDWKYLRGFLRYLFRAGKIPKIHDFKNPDPERQRGRVYSDDEIEALLENASEDLRLQILMATTMGMRKSEILLMAWDRIDMKRRVIHLRAEDTKIRKARSFAISDSVHDLLASISHEDRSPYVFPSPVSQDRPVGRDGNKTAWLSCKRRAKVRGRFHDLRHTFLTKAFKAPINPALICEYAGLSLEEAQRTYLHFTVEDTRPVANLIGVKL